VQACQCPNKHTKPSTTSPAPTRLPTTTAHAFQVCVYCIVRWLEPTKICHSPCRIHPQHSEFRLCPMDLQWRHLHMRTFCLTSYCLTSFPMAIALWASCPCNLTFPLTLCTGTSESVLRVCTCDEQLHASNVLPMEHSGVKTNVTENLGRAPRESLVANTGLLRRLAPHLVHRVHHLLQF
jgi:hypothetical protein